MLAGPLREVPGSTGMLVVESVVPDGPADGQVGCRSHRSRRCAVRPLNVHAMPCHAHPLLVPCHAMPCMPFCALLMQCLAMLLPCHAHAQVHAHAHAIPRRLPWQLEPGDVLVKLNGQIVTEFLTMEDLLDSSGGSLACGCTAKHHMWRASQHCMWR